MRLYRGQWMKVAQKPARGLQHNETVNRSNSVAERNLHSLTTRTSAASIGRVHISPGCPDVIFHSVVRTGLNADTLQPARSGQEYRSSQSTSMAARRGLPVPTY